MTTKLFIFLMISIFSIFSLFNWQRGIIADIKDQLVIARFAATENEQVTESLAKESWTTINRLKGTQDECRTILTKQKEKLQNLTKEAISHAKNLDTLAREIAKSDSKCVNTAIDPRLFNFQD